MFKITHDRTRHQRKAAIDKEMAAAPNALSVTRDALLVTRHPVHFKSPCLFWGSLLSVRN
jgi:hypothetical protein